MTEADRGEELSPRAVPDQGHQPAAGHTPGPWEVGTPGNGEPGYIYCNNSLGSAVAIAYGMPLALTVFSRAEEEANARLIAAAPELLAALKDAKSLADMVVVSDDQDGTPSDDQSSIVNLRKRIDAAIAAAEGRTNG